MMVDWQDFPYVTKITNPKSINLLACARRIGLLRKVTNFDEFTAIYAVLSC